METTPPGTPLYDTIIKAMRYTVQVSQEPVGRRGVIVITDGGDRESRNNADVVIDAARNLRIPIYTIGYTGGSRDYDQFLNELANRTGGDYRNTPDSEQFDEFLGELREELTKRYVLTFSVDDFENSRQILDVRVDYNDMVGSDSLKFDVDVQPTPTPSPTVVTATPETPSEGGTPEPTPDDGDEDQTVMEWIEDNLLLVGGLALLLIAIIVVVIVLVNRKKKSAPQAQADGYQVPDYPGGAGAGAGANTFNGGATWQPPNTGRDTWGQGGDAGLPPTDIEPPTGATEVAEGGQGYGGPQYGAGYTPPMNQPPPFTPGGQGQPPPQSPGKPAGGSTLILDRGPKLPVEAMLIDRQSNVNYSLSQPSVSVGRTPENDIKLNSDRVSRRHAVVRFENNVFYVQDLGSSNGTFVNDNRVQGQQALQDGDMVRFGNLAFVFKILS
jgi:hypothetical protein